MSDTIYTCVICGLPCKKDVKYFTLHGTKSIHTVCLEGVWESYQAMKSISKSVDNFDNKKLSSEGSEFITDIAFEPINALNAHIAELEAQLEAEREKHRWISVSERLPEVKKDTLFNCVIITPGYKPRAQTRTYWVDMGFGDPHITHWQPLPQPPETGEE